MADPSDTVAETARAKQIIDECAADDILDSNEHKNQLAPNNRPTWKRIQQAWGRLAQDEQEDYAETLVLLYDQRHRRGDRLLIAVRGLADRDSSSPTTQSDVVLDPEELRVLEKAFSVQYVD